GVRVLDTATILKQVQTVSELVTVKYVLEKVVVLEDVKWYGESRVLLVAHGVVKAGIDLGRLQAGDVHVEGQSVTIDLPPAQIIDAYLDEKRTHIVERSTGLLRTFDKNLEQVARQNAVADIRTAARVNGILKDAEERARLQLAVLFHQMGFQQVHFTTGDAPRKIEDIGVLKNLE
ncbi:MAG TPA: DUF4230 domain-containing protein, partial [Verrucomicrobiota bacterium]|nr:DUF4230 domain-containing protein [Verrucomicrobiota bacterium]